MEWDLNASWIVLQDWFRALATRAGFLMAFLRLGMRGILLGRLHALDERLPCIRILRSLLSLIDSFVFLGTIGWMMMRRLHCIGWGE